MDITRARVPTKNKKKKTTPTESLFTGGTQCETKIAMENFFPPFVLSLTISAMIKYMGKRTTLLYRH